METQQWWFKIVTYHGNVTILFKQHRSLHIMCQGLMSEGVINFWIQGYCSGRVISHQNVRKCLSRWLGYNN